MKVFQSVNKKISYADVIYDLVFIYKYMFAKNDVCSIYV